MVDISSESTLCCGCQEKALAHHSPRNGFLFNPEAGIYLLQSGTASGL